MRGRDCLYLWSDSAALELSNGSNGWFRFILDGKLATMYSSGSPEGGSDSSGELAVGGYNSSGESGFYLSRASNAPVSLWSLGGGGWGGTTLVSWSSMKELM